MFECMGKECALNSYGADQVKLLTSFVIKDLQKKTKKTPKTPMLESLLQPEVINLNHRQYEYDIKSLRMKGG